MLRSLLGYLLPLLILVGVRAVSYATPSDALWIGGIYDGGDFDNQIEPLRYLVGIPDVLHVAAVAPSPPTAEPVLLRDPFCLPRTGVPAALSRAPPAS